MPDAPAIPSALLQHSDRERGPRRCASQLGRVVTRGGANHRCLLEPLGYRGRIAGKSLFNDGVGLVVFLGLASMADLSAVATADAPGIDWSALVAFAIREVVGGVGLGLALGYLAYRALKSIDDHPLELLITLALVMFLYALSFWIHVSGPIGVVVAGLLIGNPERRFARSNRTRDHVDAFGR